jgi:hypothetical protein
MIGYQVSPSSINNKLWTLASMWRQAAYASSDFALAVAALGSSGLQGLTPAGFSPGDATLVLAQAASLGTLAGAYYGTGTITPAVNFDAAFLPLRGTG